PFQDRQRLDPVSLLDHTHVELTPIDELLDQRWRAERGLHVRDPLHQLFQVANHRAFIYADRSVFGGWLYDQWKVEVVCVLQRARLHHHEFRRPDAVELQNLLGQRLVLSKREPDRRRPRITAEAPRDPPPPPP